ncbi:hypothetical protein L2E82_04891 [Cichorium intybus]|uniref:Uncharacterized protein n=1 Tax=Cichorium intybus TaxID=13427 RepID=A0ACB9H7T1_CICIN|nr:hypothetical protein L2E82_04891 [Cichorium intybus]
MANEQAVLPADDRVRDVAVNASVSASSSSSVSSASLLTSGSVSDNAKSGKNTSNTMYDDDDDEEGDVCRICRNPGDADNPLRYPCACSGSIKFVHQDCLLQWLNHSNAWQCEVCKHPFSFSPMYAENAPAKLPFQEFVVGMSMKACHVLQFFLRLAFVLSVWLVIIPFITFWIWRFSFVRTFTEAQKLFLAHISTTIFSQTVTAADFLLADRPGLFEEEKSTDEGFGRWWLFSPETEGQ